MRNFRQFERENHAQGKSVSGQFLREEHMTENLYKKLTAYSQNGPYPFCMPGHKRNFTPAAISNPYLIDITEVEGFDDLQKCEGILGDIQKDLSSIYKCESVFMSVNGSTACNLAAVMAVPEGGRILAASNCHRSVFNGMKINKRDAVFAEPAKMPGGLCGGISADDAEKYFKEYGDIKALIVTSPSYEGFVSDIKALAGAAHRHGALLIVDEAHGAHLPFCGKKKAPGSGVPCDGKISFDGIFCETAVFPESAIYQGADIIIESLHKTLPSLNQTSLIFIPHDRELAETVKEKLNMVMTTSPFYILMASIQEAVLWAHSHPEAFENYAKRLFRLRESLKKLKSLALVDNSAAGNYNISGIDPGKLVIMTNPEKTGMSGEQLINILLKRYNLQLEKYADSCVLAMTSVMDTDEGFARLERALFDIDSRI